VQPNATRRTLSVYQLVQNKRVCFIHLIVYQGWAEKAPWIEMKRNSCRQALLEAIPRIAGSSGYGAITIVDILAEAGTSRGSFYNHFADKQDCFLAAYDTVVERVVGEVIANCEGEEDWAERVRIGLATIIEIFALKPELARTVIVEPVAAGAEGQRRRRRTIERFARLLETGQKPIAQMPLQASRATMAVGAAESLLFDEIRAGRAADLRDRSADLAFAVLVPYLGPRAAFGEAQA